MPKVDCFTRPDQTEHGQGPMAKAIFAKLLLSLPRRKGRVEEREGGREGDRLPAQLNTMQFKPAVN